MSTARFTEGFKLEAVKQSTTIAIVESFFQLRKRERIKRKIYKIRELAPQDIFDYIEMFYNPIYRHSHATYLSPINYGQQYFSEAMNCL